MLSALMRLALCLSTPAAIAAPLLLRPAGPPPTPPATASLAQAAPALCKTCAVW